MSTATDAAELVRALRVDGPTTVVQLADELDDESWDRARLEQALAAAWDADLVGLDAEDRLVAL